MILSDRFFRDVVKKILLVFLTLVLCRVTYGIWGWFLALAGIVFALKKNYSGMSFCYVIFALLAIFNRVISGLTTHLALSARFGNLVLGLVLLLMGVNTNRGQEEKLPMGWMFAYMGVAAISSIDGWFPMISYLKLLQFLGFMLGITLVGNIMSKSGNGLYELRTTIMAIAAIMIVGSFASKFVPSIGYSMHIARLEHYGLIQQASVVGTAEGGMSLFNGLTMHSQMLAPVVSMLAAWVLCDMLLVAQRFTALHTVILAVSPILLYLSRSRGGFFTFVVVMFLTGFVCLPRARISRRHRNQLTMAFVGIIVAMAIGGTVMEIRDNTFSKWLRKTEDVRSDSRSLSEAVTSSRMDLIQANMEDFYRNPLLGKGFQVAPYLIDAYKAGQITWFSAPVEKGVTPVVVLGETGILGGIVFVVFLVTFYKTCIRRRYLALMNLFTCLFVANLADSTMFSPAGLGGFLWVISCVGGFGIDLLAIRMARGDYMIEYNQPIIR